MEYSTMLALGLVTPVAVIGFKGLNKYWKNRLVTVPCHFCNTQTQVPAKFSNNFTCCNCDQYNGFTDDGDYNKVIPDMYKTPTIVRTYARRTQIQPANEDSQLCSRCINNVAKKQQMIANFTPENKDKFSSELANYKARLERIFGLCAKCEIKLRKKLEAEAAHLKRIYSQPLRTLQRQDSFAPRLAAKLNEIDGQQKGYIRKSSGWKAITLQFINFLLLLLITIADYHSIQLDNKIHLHQQTSSSNVLFAKFVKFLQRPPNVSLLLVAILFIQSFAMFVSLARLNINDMYLCLIVLISLIVRRPEMVTESVDRHVYSLATSIAAIIIAIFTIFYPRRRLRTTKNKIASCFSVVGSPDSQCSCADNKSTTPNRFENEIPYNINQEFDATTNNDDESMMECDSVDDRSRYMREKSPTPNRVLTPMFKSFSLGTDNFSKRHTPNSKLGNGETLWQRNTRLGTPERKMAASIFGGGNSSIFTADNQTQIFDRAYTSPTPMKSFDSLSSSFMTSASRRNNLEKQQQQQQQQQLPEPAGSVHCPSTITSGSYSAEQIQSMIDKALKDAMAENDKRQFKINVVIAVVTTFLISAIVAVVVFIVN